MTDSARYHQARGRGASKRDKVLFGPATAQGNDSKVFSSSSGVSVYCITDELKKAPAASFTFFSRGAVLL